MIQSAPLTRELSEPPAAQVRFLDSIHNLLVDFVDANVGMSRRGLLYVSQPCGEDCDDELVSYYSGSLGLPLTLRELNLSGEGIQEVMHLIEEECSETEIWLLLSYPSLEGGQFALTRFYVGHTVNWALNQPSLFAFDSAA